MSRQWLANSESAILADRACGNLVRLKPITRTAWDHFVAGCPDILLFHTSDWLMFLSQVYDIMWHSFGVWLGDELVGIFPLMTRKLGPFRLAGVPLMQVIASTPYMGPIISSEQFPSTLAALNDVLLEQRIDHIEMALPFLLENTTAPMRLGYSIEVCQTVLVHLTERTPKQIWHSLSSSCRRAVCKAEANNVKIIEAHDSDFLDEYYRMCEEVYRGSGRPPHLSKAFYSAIWHTFARKGNLKVLLATHEGAVLAGGMFLLYGRTAYYLSGASYHIGLRLRPNNLIQWHFIEWAISEGYDLYDMGGAVHPGITRFKLGFGGQLSTYTRLYRANSALARLGRIIYKYAIPLWRRQRAK